MKLLLRRRQWDCWRKQKQEEGEAGQAGEESEAVRTTDDQEQLTLH